jgi:hypothetical protein
MRSGTMALSHIMSAAMLSSFFKSIDHKTSQADSNCIHHSIKTPRSLTGVNIQFKASFLKPITRPQCNLCEVAGIVYSG